MCRVAHTGSPARSSPLSHELIPIHRQYCQTRCFVHLFLRHLRPSCEPAPLSSPHRRCSLFFPSSPLPTATAFLAFTLVYKILDARGHGVAYERAGLLDDSAEAHGGSGGARGAGAVALAPLGRRDSCQV